MNHPGDNTSAVTHTSYSNSQKNSPLAFFLILLAFSLEGDFGWDEVEWPFTLWILKGVKNNFFRVDE